jgi:hypothetical protein
MDDWVVKTGANFKVWSPIGELNNFGQIDMYVHIMAKPEGKTNRL